MDLKISTRLTFRLFVRTGPARFQSGANASRSQGKGLSSHAATVATIIGNCGAVAGGTFAGYASQYLGRRITIIMWALSSSVAFVARMIN